MSYEELSEREVRLKSQLKDIQKNLKKLQAQRLEEYRNGELDKITYYADVKEEYVAPRKYFSLKVPLERIAYEHPEYVEEKEGYEQIRKSKV